MLTVWLSHDRHIVHLWMMHGHQSRVIIKQHRQNVIYINRVAIQQRLLVKFSCDPHNDICLRNLLLMTLLVFVTSGCHNNTNRSKIVEPYHGRLSLIEGISIIEDWISGLLHYHYRNILWKEQLSQRTGLCCKFWNNRITTKTYLQNRQT